MADTPDSHNDAASGDAPTPQIRVLAQYIKDLSFENPSAPGSLRAGQDSPQIDMGIDVQARRADEHAYEVVLNLEAKAHRGDTVAFIVELKYAGLFHFVNMPENAIEQMLLIESPRMLFPFARRLMAEVTRDGGFPPLYIDPIDFAGLYLAQKRRAEAGSDPADGAPTAQA